MWKTYTFPYWMRVKTVDLGKGLKKHIILTRHKKTTIILTRDGYIRKPRLVSQALREALGIKEKITAKDFDSYCHKNGITGKRNRILFREYRNKRLFLKVLRSLEGLTQEQIHDLLLIEFTNGYYYGEKESLSWLHKNVSWKSFLKNLEHRHFADIARMARDYVLSGYELPKLHGYELHNFLSREIARISTQNHSISYTKKELDFLESIQGDLIAKYPAMTHDLIDWGNELSHCIGSYQEIALRKQQLFVAFYLDGKLLYTMSLRPDFQVIQFYGKRNSEPDERHRFEIIQLINGFVDASISTTS